MGKDSIITMDYGSGGVKTSELIERVLKPAFDNCRLNELGDGALLPVEKGEIAFSADSFVVQPLFFPGGDIGKLAVCGTVNDISMCGAVPEWLSLSMIIEEGLPMKTLEIIVESIAKTAKEAGVQIVTGDTKVVEKGKCDGLYLNTSGVGVVACCGLGVNRLLPTDKVILTGPIGDHGTAVMLARNQLGLLGEVESDCMPLNHLAQAAWENGDIHIMRDATRGGVATTLNEFVEGRDIGIRIWSEQIPIRPQVSAACDVLGLDPLYCANEGRMICVVSSKDAAQVVDALRLIPGGENSTIIGEVTDEFPGKVVLRTELGAHRILSKLTGDQLPRIC